MSVMDGIKKSFCGFEDKDPFDDDTTWQSFIKKYNSKTILNNIKEIVGNECYPKYWEPKPRQKERYTINTKGNRPNVLAENKSMEVPVERYITAANCECMYNQWYVGPKGGKPCVDMVYIAGDNLYDIIELKIARTGSDADSPALAFLESLMNYCHIENLKKNHDEAKNIKIRELCLLAPKTYYKKILEKNSDKFRQFIEIINDYNTISKNPRFCMYYIDIDENVLCDTIREYFEFQNTEKAEFLPEVKLCNWFRDGNKVTLEKLKEVGV